MQRFIIEIRSDDEYDSDLLAVLEETLELYLPNGYDYLLLDPEDEDID